MIRAYFLKHTSWNGMLLMKGFADEWVDVLTERCKLNYSDTFKMKTNTSGNVLIIGDAVDDAYTTDVFSTVVTIDI